MKHLYLFLPFTLSLLLGACMTPLQGPDRSLSKPGAQNKFRVSIEPRVSTAND